MIGAHYPGDVAAGFFVALVSAAIVTRLARRLVVATVSLVEQLPGAPTSLALDRNAHGRQLSLMVHRPRGLDPRVAGAVVAVSVFLKRGELRRLRLAAGSRRQVVGYLAEVDELVGEVGEPFDVGGVRRDSE